MCSVYVLTVVVEVGLGNFSPILEKKKKESITHPKFCYTFLKFIWRVSSTCHNRQVGRVDAAKDFGIGCKKMVSRVTNDILYIIVLSPLTNHFTTLICLL